MARHDDGRVPELVRELAVPLAEDLDIEVLDVEIGGPSSRPLIRVIADVADPTSDAGMDVAVAAKLSRRLDQALDEQDLLPGPFTLEVTSPGADRPLTEKRDFQRNVGRDVRVTPAEQATDDAEVTGRLVDVDDDEVTLVVDGRDVRIAFADLDHGKVVLPW
jgi:ribosome maturation factor RimP